jgi:uncharacterized protein
MKYRRQITPRIIANLGQKPILLLYGARQVGKTTLVKTIMVDFKNPLYLQGDDPKDAMLLANKSGQELVTLLTGHDVVVIDEAQRIEHIGTTLKLIADNMSDVRLIATGSSAFELANKVSEPLTGRNRTMQLYPLSIPELAEAANRITVQKDIENLLTFGMYPQIVAARSTEEKATLVKELTNDYLFKDLFLFGDIRNAFAFEKLVKLLALRIGSEVSYTELAKEIGISRLTVETYIKLLEQAFIIFRLTPLYTNKTKEINKNHKIYFYDTGLRNALLSTFSPLELRPDKGALLENFFIAEMLKQRAYTQRDTSMHFWRGRQGGEVDYLEYNVSHHSVEAFECKWSAAATVPKLFQTQYPQSTFTVVTIQNIVEVIMTN